MILAASQRVRCLFANFVVESKTETIRRPDYECGGQPMTSKIEPVETRIHERRAVVRLLVEIGVSDRGREQVPLLLIAKLHTHHIDIDGIGLACKRRSLQESPVNQVVVFARKQTQRCAPRPSLPLQFKSERIAAFATEIAVAPEQPRGRGIKRRVSGQL